MKQLVVHKGRTNIVPVSMGFDVSQDTFASEIRVGKKSSSDLIASWDIAFETDGVDGELVLTLDDLVSGEIEETLGYMDIKRTSGSEPLPVFDEPLEVLLVSSITA